MKKITIVIPCYNESSSLLELINQLKTISNDFNFILVDNGSTDDTQNVLKTINIPENIKILKKQTNEGYGAGIKYGLKNVKTEFTGWMHADLQQDANVLLNGKILLESLIDKKSKDIYAVKGLRNKKMKI